MTCFIVGNVAIHDRERYRLYEADFMPILQRFGGRVVAVSDAPEPLEGDWGPGRLVILSFDSQDAARVWMISPEYQAIAQHRFVAADATIVMADGLG